MREVARYRLTRSTLVSDIASARTHFADRAPVLVETVLLRRKAAAKFADPSDWLFTDEALQQATAEPVAEHRARRLAGAPCTTRPVPSAPSLRRCGIGRRSWWAVISTRCGWRWRGTIVARRGPCAAPMRCGRSPRRGGRSSIPARRSGSDGAGSILARLYCRRWTSCSTCYRGTRLRREVRSGNRFRLSAAAGIRRRGRGDVAGGQRPRSVPVVARASGAGVRRRATMLDTASSSPTPSPTTAGSPRPAGGSSTPTGRWSAPGWCAITPPGTVCGSSTPTSPTCPVTDCPTACAVSRCSSNSASANGACARRFRRATSERSRSWFAASMSTPMHYGRGCACAARRTSPWSSPVSAPGAASRATAFICRPSR